MGSVGDGEREKICLGANKPYCCPNAEVELNPPGIFLHNFIYILLLSIKKKKL